MADRITTEFPKMGPYPTSGEVVNTSAAPSPNTIPVPSGNSKDGRITGSAAHRKGKLERLGAKGAPTAKLYEANAASSSATGRNVTIMPSATGFRDFRLKSRYGQNTQ